MISFSVKMDMAHDNHIVTTIRTLLKHFGLVYIAKQEDSCCINKT